VNYLFKHLNSCQSSNTAVGYVTFLLCRWEVFKCDLDICSPVCDCTWFYEFLLVNVKIWPHLGQDCFFHVLSNSLFTNLLIIQCYITELLTAALHNHHIYIYIYIYIYRHTHTHTHTHTHE
jgi:hypothetical protein